MEKHAILNLAAAVLLVMNVLSFSLMGADKRRARQGKWRIRERTLLTASALFGALGGLLGMKCFINSLPWAFRSCWRCSLRCWSGCAFGALRHKTEAGNLDAVG